MPFPAHISELEPHHQDAHAVAKRGPVVVRRAGDPPREYRPPTGHMVIDHPEHGPIKVELSTGNITRYGVTET